MRLDHIAYRVKDRNKTASFIKKVYGYHLQQEFEIQLDDGTCARCIALQQYHGKPEMFILHSNHLDQDYHLAPEIFVSDGPPGSLIDRWVEQWGRGVGGIHHLAYMVPNVAEHMKYWQANGLATFTTDEPLTCEGVRQVFTDPHPLTGIVYEFIEREEFGFCKDNVSKLMDSTKGHLNEDSSGTT